MVLLLIIIGTNAIAQRNNQVPANRTLQTNASAKKFELSPKPGQIVISDGKNETVVSDNPNDVSPIIHGNEVYYMRQINVGTANGTSSIFVYDIASKSTTDIIKPSAATSNYDPKNMVENIIMDKGNNKLFFSTSKVNPRGYTEFLTWKYDPATKELAVYKDGKIESIDPMGNQTIVFESYDAKGKFTTRSLMSSEGHLQKVSAKEYTQVSSNK